MDRLRTWPSKVFNHFTPNCFSFGKILSATTIKSYLTDHIIQVSKSVFHKNFLAVVSLWSEIKSDWPERTIFGQKFVLYYDRSLDGRWILMGNPMCSGQPWDSWWPVMRHQPVLGRNNISVLWWNDQTCRFIHSWSANCIAIHLIFLQDEKIMATIHYCYANCHSVGLIW